MKAVKIVILLSVPDGTEIEVRSGTPEPVPSQAPPRPPREAIPPRSDAVPVPVPDFGPLDALNALKALGVEHPTRYTDRFATERILAVCRHASKKGDSLKKPAAWVVSALTRNWTVPGNGR